MFLLEKTLVEKRRIIVKNQIFNFKHSIQDDPNKSSTKFSIFRKSAAQYLHIFGRFSPVKGNLKLWVIFIINKKPNNRFLIAKKTK